MECRERGNGDDESDNFVNVSTFHFKYYVVQILWGILRIDVCVQYNTVLIKFSISS